jgi:3-deoxy-D-manno-octulosonic acid kinase
MSAPGGQPRSTDAQHPASTPELRFAGPIVTLHDAARYPDFDAAWLDRGWWLAQGARTHSITGRPGVLMLERGDETWVYRHYHRGGLVAKLCYDEYFWTGAQRSRPVREWHVLDRLTRQGLPAPRPVAARAVRSGAIYRADILTVLLPDTVPLSSRIGELWEDTRLWPAIGAMVAGFHRAGCDHPDLTAHNILVDPARRPYLVDFDNARLRRPGGWQQAGVDRLQRSLRKVALETGTRFDEAAWAALDAAYRSASA